jgi:hypothetical protein
LIIRFHHRFNKQECDEHGLLHRPPTSDNARSAHSQRQQWHLSNGRISEAQAPTTQFGLSAMCLAEDEMRAQSCARQMREVSSLPKFLLHLHVKPCESAAHPVELVGSRLAHAIPVELVEPGGGVFETSTHNDCYSGFVKYGFNRRALRSFG